MFDLYKHIIIVMFQTSTQTYTMPMPEFIIMADEDLLNYVEQEDLRCKANKAAAQEERREDHEHLDNTKSRLVNLRLRHDHLLQHLSHPRITPGRRTQIRQEIREIKGQLDTLMDYLRLYYDLLIVRDQQLQESYGPLLQATEELIERGLEYTPF